MKHKLSVLPVLFTLLALVFVLTACGSEGNVQSEGVIKPRTITFYSITDEATTDEAVQRVEDELNKITESLYKVHVVLKLYPEDEYEEVLKKAIIANEDGVVFEDTDVLPDDSVTSGVGETDTDDEVVYADAVENQLDVFLIPDGSANFDKYALKYLQSIEYGEGGVLADLSSYVAEGGAGYVLNQYIPKKTLDFCRGDSADATSPLYGLPSNSYYGDAEYMLINKKLFDEYNYDPSIITDMFSVQSFLADLAADCGPGKKLSNTVPLYNTPEMGVVSLTGRNSVVAQYVSPSAHVSNGSFTPMNILAIPNVQKTLAFVNSVHAASGIMPRVTKNVDFNAQFGAAFVRGNDSVYDVYGDDYHIILTGIPYAKGEDVYKGVYAVSKYAEMNGYADRCVEVLTCLNTNAEFRNLLAYGIENINYITDEETGYLSFVDASKYSEETDDDEKGPEVDMTYKMDLERTGNMFLLKQNDQMTEEELLLSANNWKYAIATNNHAIVSPYAKFKFTAYTQGTPSTAETVKELEVLYDEIWTWVAEYETYSDPTTGEKMNTFSEYVLVLQKELEKNIYVKAASDQLTPTSISGQYTNWYAGMYGGMPTE
ncbi:MAG: hypothetical protein IJD35_03065 [Clostridia bacterium]|nr:hypothetical protein [Clostridia bacterium]